MKEKKIFIFDMDGVLYRHEDPIPSAISIVKKLKQMKKKVIYLTNNSTKTPQEFANKLKRMGIDEDPNNIYTSATITASNLSKMQVGKTAYVIGMNGLRLALKENGFKLLNEIYTDIDTHSILPEDAEADLVVMGMDTNLTYAKMRTALMLIIKGARFFCTNGDYNFPVPGTLWPGTGAQIAFLERALGYPPEKIFGKPNPDGIFKILEDNNMKNNEAVVIGDRFDTDIWAGNNAGVVTVCVETGINTSKDLQNTPSEQHPTFIFPTLKDWFDQYF